MKSTTTEEPTVSLSPYRQVIEDAINDGTIDPLDDTIVFLNINRAVNMTGGRASDAARSEVAAYKRQGREAYIADFHHVRGTTPPAPTHQIALTKAEIGVLWGALQAQSPADPAASAAHRKLGEVANRIAREEYEDQD